MCFRGWTIESYSPEYKIGTRTHPARLIAVCKRSLKRFGTTPNFFILALLVNLYSQRTFKCNWGFSNRSKDKKFPIILNVGMMLSA